MSARGGPDILVLYFENGEMLQAWEPRGLDSAHVRVPDARRVRLDWFKPGVVRSIAGRYWIEFERDADGVVIAADVPWASPDRGDGTAPAVELVRR